MDKKILLIPENILTSSVVRDLLIKMDGQFDVTLSSYINLTEWSKKLAHYAKFCMCSKQEGLIAYYTDIEHKSSYITLVWVEKSYQNCGIATLL